jgi:simple sugar transport system permease protein
MRRLQTAITDIGMVAATIGACAILMTVLLMAAGYPARILIDWMLGACGSQGQILLSLKNACPLILTGLAAGVAFRTGVFNIGAEGQSIVATIGVVALGTRWLPSVPAVVAIPAAIMVGILAGAAWAGIPAALDRFRGVPVVLSTILLNFVAISLCRLLVKGALASRTTAALQSDTLPDSYILPVLLHATGGYVHAGILAAVAVAAICWMVQARTAFGFEVLVTGLNPVAARYAGMPAARRQFEVMLGSGGLAGLAGALQVMGVEGSHFINIEPVAYGYAGIAVALLGRLHPAGIVAAAIFFAMLDTGADILESRSSLPHQVSDIAKGLIVLVILAAAAVAARRRSAAVEG